MARSVSEILLTTGSLAGLVPLLAWLAQPACFSQPMARLPASLLVDFGSLFFHDTQAVRLAQLRCYSISMTRSRRLILYICDSLDCNVPYEARLALSLCSLSFSGSLASLVPFRPWLARLRCSSDNAARSRSLILLPLWARIASVRLAKNGSLSQCVPSLQWLALAERSFSLLARSWRMTLHLLGSLKNIVPGAHWLARLHRPL
jgi:hypothetical protein